MKKIFFVVAFTALLGIVFLYAPIASAASSSSTSPPVQVVVVSGSNYQMGVQYGEQAAPLIAANRDEVWNLMETQTLDVNGNPVGYSVLLNDIKVWNYYINKYDPELVRWLQGISKGCANEGYTVSYTDLVAIMVYPQEVWARPGMAYPSETNVAALNHGKIMRFLAKGRTSTNPMSSCTSFTASGSATRGGVPMTAITVGVPLQVTNYVILVAFPNHGYPFINLAQAGRVASNSGMNDHYSWTMTAAVNAPWMACASSWGVTSEVYFHYLLQYCKSPSEAVKYIKSTPVGGVTGNFLFADSSGKIFVYEVGACGSAVLKPADIGANKDFICHTNDYLSSAMAPYNLGADYFPDTFVRYATIFKELSSAKPGTIGLNFAKSVYLSNSWYDASTNTWNTVPVPSDPNDLNTCNVPGNMCEGGTSQVIQFPAQKTAYLEVGDPQGTSIQYFWPPSPNPAPTGQYTKWELGKSPWQMAQTESMIARKMLHTASVSLHKATSLDPATKSTLDGLLSQASDAFYQGKWDTTSLAGRQRHAGALSGGVAQMATWGTVYTDYATAQLYAQMVSAQLQGAGK